MDVICESLFILQIEMLCFLFQQSFELEYRCSVYTDTCNIIFVFYKRQTSLNVPQFVPAVGKKQIENNTQVQYAIIM